MRLAGALLGLVLGCGDGGPGVDAGVDAGTDAGPADAGVSPPAVAPAALPVLTPCPPGWREVTRDGLAECDPWPAAGPPGCPEGEAFRPGDSGCTRVGAACPGGDGFPEDLPATGVIYVRAAATAGDGTRGAPFGDIGSAVASAPDGAIIAVAQGRYLELIRLVGRDLVLRGACTATVIAGSGAFPVVRLEGGRVELRDLTVTAGAGTGGFFIRNAATVALRGVIIEDAPVDGVSVSGGSTLDAEDVIVRRVQNSAVSVFDSRAEVRRLHVDTAADALQADNGDLVVRDAAFLDVGGAGSLTSLVGAYRGSSVRIERGAFRGPFTQSFTVIGTSRLELQDVVVTEGAGGDVVNELGVIAFGASTVLLSRVVLSGVPTLAAGAGETGTSLEARDLIIRDMRPGLASPTGHAVEVGGGAMLSVERLLVERAIGAALVAADPGTVLSLADVTVRATASVPDGRYGRALQIQTSASATGARLAVADNHEASIVAATAGAEVALTDVSVERTAVRGCAMAGCPGAGIGIGAYEGGHLAIERFVVRDNALCGVQVARDGAMDLRSGEVSGHPIGANVQVPGYDVGRLSDRVLYRDNDRDLDAEALAVPDPTTPSGM